MSESPLPVDPEALLAHAGWMRRVAVQLVRDPARAEDTIQDAWVAALRHPPRHGRNLASWLGGLVRNSARETRRNEARRVRREAAVARTEALPSAAELVQQAEVQRELVTAILGLEDPYRSTVLLRYYQDRSPQEIAELQGIPGSTVRSRLKRGLEQLRTQLDDRFESDRRAWSLMLLPHSSAPGAPDSAVHAATSLLGIVTMALKTKLALATVLIVLAAVGWVTWPTPLSVAPELHVAQGRTELDAPEAPLSADVLADPNVHTAGTSQRTAVDRLTGEGLPSYLGVVRDPTGAPIEGVTLALHYTGQDWRDTQPIGWGTSDPQGRFRIQAKADPDRTLLIFAEALGHSSTSMEPAVPDDEMELELDWVTEIFGIVTDAETGSPVAGATVSTWSEKVTAGADGSFRLTNIIVGRNTDLWATGAGYAEQAREVTLREPQETRLDFSLQGGVPLTLEVIDATNASPISGAELYRFPGIGEPLGRSDGEGRVELRVVDGGELHLVIRADGYSSFIWLWDVAGAAELSPRIPMLGWAWIEGTVLDADGNPVRARAHPENEALPFEHRDLTPAEQADNNVPGLCWYEGEGSGGTDEQGRFLLPVLPCEEPYHLRVSNTEHFPATVGPFLLDSPGSRVTVAVRLERGAVVRGRAIYNGEPWTRGSVWARDPEGEMLARVHIRGEGEYELRVPPGQIRLQLQGLMGDPLAQEVVLTAEDGREYRRDFSWEEEMATISGQIANPSGAPMPDMVVIARARDSIWTRASGKSDEEGRYVIDVQASGTYDVSVKNGPVSDEQEDVSPGATDVDLVLPVLGKLWLRLVDAASGEPIRGFSESLWPVAWRPSGDEAFRTLRINPDVEGILEFDLPVGLVDVSLILGDEGFAKRKLMGLQVTNSADELVTVELDRGASLTLTFESEPELDREQTRGHLIFVLEESELNALRGSFPSQGGPSNLRINGVNMWLREPGLMQRLLDVGGNGTLRVGGLAPGRYWLRAYPDAFVFEPESIEVGEENVSVTVRWRRR